MDYNNLLYKRGFLFSQVRISPPIPTWVSATVGDYFISYDPENQWAFLQNDNDWCALLGKVVDTLNWNTNIQFIVGECLARLNHSEERMLDYIDYLSGRFIIIYHHGSKTKLMNDAFGTRSVFYSMQDSVLIASHCRIISDYLDSIESRQMVTIGQDKRWRSLKSHAYPGILTPYEGVYVLTPNTLIDIKERAIRRFYPRKELPTNNLTDVVDEVSAVLRRQLELLHSKYKLAFSLSAGLDSRTTLALAKNIAAEALFFTYSYPNEALYWKELGLVPCDARGDTHEKRRASTLVDLSVASEIAKAFGLQHTPLDVSASHDEFLQFEKVVTHNTHYRHARRVAFEYLNQLPSGLLHIRSNVSSCARAFNRPKTVEIPITPEKMAQEASGMGNNRIAVEAFQQFEKVTEFANILNYDPYDMFLWEHHEGTWLGYVLLESDVAFDTFEIWNCRALMEKALSVPLEHRLKSAIHFGIIEHLWPLLLAWPINNGLPYRQQIGELRAENAVLKSELAKTKKRLQIEESFSYRLGATLVKSVASPGLNSILLPYRLIDLCIREVVRRST